MKRYKYMQINTHISILYTVTNSIMNYFLDLNRNTPRKDTLTIAYINDCELGKSKTSKNNQNDRVAIETNKSNFCMLLRLNNQLLHIHQYFLRNFIILISLINLFFCIQNSFYHFYRIR